MSETYRQWTVPLPSGVKHRELWTMRENDDELLIVNCTRSELLQLADNLLGAAEVQG